MTVDRPVEEVFAFLADGENDKKFSPRIVEIEKTTDGPPGVGTVYASTAKDGGIKAKHEFELTEFEPPTQDPLEGASRRVPVFVTEGGYDMAPAEGGGTELSFFNELEGRGFRQADRRPGDPLGPQGRRRLSPPRSSARSSPAASRERMHVCEWFAGGVSALSRAVREDGGDHPDQADHDADADAACERPQLSDLSTKFPNLSINSFESGIHATGRVRRFARPSRRHAPSLQHSRHKRTNPASNVPISREISTGQ